MKYLHIIGFLLLPYLNYCQTITGIVHDQNNLPLSGITVTAKDTHWGTITNERGFFKIKISDSSRTLKFSGSGFEPLEIQAGTQREMSVTLYAKVSTLDEVQVIAYGTSTQRYNVGSVSKVNANDIEIQPISNPLAALEGRVPGLVVTATSGMPGASFNVQIRGQNTLKSNLNQLTPALDNPIFIIDGVPFSPQNSNINQLSSVLSPGGGIYNNASGGVSPFNSISPSDIESITVLRDADATAIYGSRGGNGVILITTKKGTAGNTDFNVNGSEGVSITGKTMRMMNTQEYLTMRREAIANDGLQPNLTLFNAAYAPDLLLFDTTKYTDWKNYFIGNTAHNTTINTSLSGGSASTQFRLAAGYNRNTYVFPGSFDDNRINFSSNLHHSSKDNRFNVDFSSAYSYYKNNSSGTPNLNTAFRLEPNMPDLIDNSGNLIWDVNGYPLLSSTGNPLSFIKEKYNIQTTNLISSLQLSYKLLNSVTIRSNFGYNSLFSKEYSGNPKSIQNPLSNGQASANFGTNNYTTWIIEPQIEYKKEFNKNRLDVLAGGTFQRNSNATTQMSGYGYLNDDLIGSISAAPTRDASDGFSEYKYMAFFGRVNYMYDKKYIVDLNARRDGSSRFGPGKQFGNFGSIGAGWLFSEEKFIKDNLKFISYGKLHGSYGTTGSDAIADYQYLSRWATTYYSYNGQLGYLPQNLFNSTLSWASTKKLEAGIELGLIRDKILFNLTWYRDRSGNQLVTYNLPSQTGFNNIVENWNALVQNQGYEITIQTSNIKGRDFSWTSAFNLTIPKNKLLSFPGLESSSYSTVYTIGQSVNSVLGFKYAGVNDTIGLFQFENANNQITSAPVLPSSGKLNDYRIIGNLDPKFYGGFQNTITFKQFQLDIFLEFKKQLGVNYLQQVYSTPPGYEFNVPAALLARWQQPGDKTNIEKFITSQNTIEKNATRYFLSSSGSYSDASYLRFKTISLSYTFDNRLIHHFGLKSLRLYGSAQNLFTITKYLGNDPETQNFYGVPVLKTIVFGLQITL